MKALFLQNQRQQTKNETWQGQVQDPSETESCVSFCAILAQSWLSLFASEAHSGHLCWNMGQAIELVNGGDPAAAKKKLGISAHRYHRCGDG